MTAQDLKNSILFSAMTGKFAYENKSKEVQSIHFAACDIDCDLPSNWIVVSFADLNLIDAKVPFFEGKKKYYSTGSIQGNTFVQEGEYDFTNKPARAGRIGFFNSVIEARMQGTIKATIVKEELADSLLSTGFFQIGEGKTYIQKYIQYFLLSPIFVEQKNALCSGTTQKAINDKALKSIQIPLPPLAEQERIVAKIEELLPLIEEYDKAGKRLSELNAEFPDKLRKSILQQAVMGKLTERDPADEPASELLKRIRTEKEKLIKEGKIKKEKPLPPISEDEIPFEIPDTWEWVRLSNLSIAQITYGIIKLGEEDKNGVKVLRCSDVKPGWIDHTGIRTVKKSLSDEYERTILRGGEIVINVRGTLGGCAIVPQEFAGYNVAREVAVIPLSDYVNSSYLMYLLLSPTFDNYLSDNLRGVAYKGLNIELLSSFVISLPPLAEQKRIVARVEELLKICDELR